MANEDAERRALVTRGTGNVFADLGLFDAAERQAKLRLTRALNHVLEARKRSQERCGQGLGGDAGEDLCASSLQAGGLLRRTPDEPVDAARPGRRDRDSEEAALAEGCSDQRRGRVRGTAVNRKLLGFVVIVLLCAGCEPTVPHERSALTSAMGNNDMSISAAAMRTMVQHYGGPGLREALKNPNGTIRGRATPRGDR